MAKDDQPGQQDRANDLRQRISKLKSEENNESSWDSDEKPSHDNSGKAESPRDFIRDRMRDLDRK